VVCPAAGYARGRFSLSRTYLEPTSIKFRFLRAAIQGFGLDLPATAGSDFEVSATDRLDVAQLRGYYEEAGNILQLTAPLPAVGDPQQVLDDVYKDFVAPRIGGANTVWNRGAATQVFRRVFKRNQLDDWVVSAPEVKLENQPSFVFDVGIGNGRLHAVIENASYRQQDAQRPEELAAWMAFAYPIVHRATGATGIFFVETGTNPESHARLDRLKEWTKPTGIQVYEASSAPEVAQELASKLKLRHWHS